MATAALPRRTLCEKLEFVLSSFSEHDLKVAPSSRVGAMRRLFFNKDGSTRGVIQPSDPEHDVAIEALRDLNVLAFVFDAIPYDDLDAYRSKLQSVICDPALPQDSKVNSPGRDTQAELFVAAICWNAKLLPVSMSEPDVQCTIRDRTFGFAVKRLKTNVDRLETRIKEGAKQIARSKQPGVIVLDTSLLLNPSNDRIWQQINDTDFGIRYMESLNQFVRDRHHDFRRCVRGKGVHGIIIMDSQVRLTSDGWEHCGGNLRVPMARENTKRWREFQTLWTALERGIPQYSMRTSGGRTLQAKSAAAVKPPFRRFPLRPK